MTVSYVFGKHPLEIRQEDKVPELAAAIRECSIWPRHRSLAVFWSPAKATDRSREFNVIESRHFALGRATKRVMLDDGSHPNVMDNFDLADFIHHHAWFEGTRSLFHEKIESTCLEISQARRTRNAE